MFKCLIGKAFVWHIYYCIIDITYGFGFSIWLKARSFFGRIFCFGRMWKMELRSFSAYSPLSIISFAHYHLIYGIDYVLEGSIFEFWLDHPYFDNLLQDLELWKSQLKVMVLSVEFYISKPFSNKLSTKPINSKIAPPIDNSK